jgi:hypothetical protein
MCCREISDMRTEDIKVHNGGKGQNEGNKENERKQEQISGGGEIFPHPSRPVVRYRTIAGGKATGT